MLQRNAAKFDVSKALCLFFQNIYYRTSITFRLTFPLTTFLTFDNCKNILPLDGIVFIAENIINFSFFWEEATCSDEM